MINWQKKLDCFSGGIMKQTFGHNSVLHQAKAIESEGMRLQMEDKEEIPLFCRNSYYSPRRQPL